MKKVLVGCLISSITFVLTAGSFLLVDLYYHRRCLQGDLQGPNWRGYRGPVVGRKLPHETRIVMCGGSTTFGYGLRYKEALPYQLEQKLQALLGPQQKVSVINLGYNMEGVYAFYYNLSDFRDLDYDVVILYEGYNDLRIGTTGAYRHSNPIFRLCGYMPVLPMLAREKIMSIRSRGHLDDAYNRKQFVFRLKPTERLHAAVLDNLLAASDGFETALKRLDPGDTLGLDLIQLKNNRWAWYEHFEKRAIEYSLHHHKKVIVMTQPFINKTHREQQAALQAMLASDFKGSNDLLYVNAGEDLDLLDPKLSFDGMHLTAGGCDYLAAKEAPKMRGFISSRRKDS
jgi:hypothetical protein